MKIIITYASAGTGHRRAAEALYNYFKENCPCHDLQIIDALEKTNFLFKNIYSHGYLFLVNHALWLWRFSFRITRIRCLRPATKILVFIINRINTKNFAQFLLQENPDFIISTHFFPSEIAGHLKKKQRLASKLITVITDFGVHPFWISDATDIYIVAADSTKEQLVSQGIKEDRIKVLGIPVDAKFLKRYDKNILYKKFALQAHKFTVLIVTGSFGIGRIEEAVDLLYKEVQILVVCANNKRLYKRLKNKNYPNVSVFGFIDNIQELMAISDIIITKPGGLTISEVLTMELLPVFISAIPGQETENIKALKQYGVGKSARHLDDIRNIVLDYKEHPDKFRETKEHITAIRKPFAAEELCNVICQGSIRATG